MRTRSSSRRRSHGQSLVEFALAIPLFLFVLFALIDIGRLVYINNALSEGAREGSRWGSVLNRSATPANVQSHAIDFLTAVPNPDVNVTCVTKTDGTTAVACATGQILIVRVASPVTMLTPILSQIVGPRTYTATSKTTVN